MITNNNDIIDINELSEYIEYLEQYDPDNEDLQNLKGLKSQLFIDEGTLVHENCVLDYAKRMVSDCYDQLELPWFMEIIIDYDAIIDTYVMVDYDGATYYIVD